MSKQDFSMAYAEQLGKRLVQCAFFVAGFSVAVAQGDETSRLAPVTSTVERPPTVPHSGAVYRVERAEFDNRLVTLSDVLAQQPATQIRQTGGLGGVASLSIRGAQGKQIPVYLDGLLLNDPVSGAVDLSLFTLHDIERIEIFPGLPPADLPHASVGGALRLTSRPLHGDEQHRLSLGAGSFGARKVGIHSRGQARQWRYWLALQHQQADNDFTYANRSAWFNPNDGARSRRRNAAVDQQDVSLRLGRELHNGHQIDSLLQWQQQQRQVPSIQNWANNDAEQEQQQWRWQLQWRTPQHHPTALQRQHRLAYQQRDDAFTDSSGRIGQRNANIEQNSDSWSSDHRWHQPLTPQHAIAAGIDLQWQRQDSIDRQRNRDERAERQQATLALSHHYQDAQGLWQINSVVRTLYSDDQRTTPDGRDQQTHSPLSAQIDLRRALTSGLSASLGVGRQVRIPTLQERFGQQGSFVGNPQLQPETARIIEAGLQGDYSRWQWNTSVFQRDLDPAITPLFDARGVGRHVNVAARVRGVEGRLQTDISDIWQVGVHGTLLDSENRSRALADQRGKQLAGVYHRSAQLFSRWAWYPWHAEIRASYDDDLFYDAANLLQADARQRLDARLGWERPWRGQLTRIDLEINNLNNALYQDFNRQPSSGRAFFITLQHQL